MQSFGFECLSCIVVSLLHNNWQSRVLFEVPNVQANITYCPKLNYVRALRCVYQLGTNFTTNLPFATMQWSVIGEIHIPLTTT